MITLIQLMIFETQLESAGNETVKSHMNSIFEKLGISLKGYLNIKQMQYAYKLIMEGSNITDAAYAAGFGSSAHLAYICKKQMKTKGAVYHGRHLMNRNVRKIRNTRF